MVTEDFCKVPCKECPFRVDSLPGWLGDFTLEETLLAANHDQDFLCHMEGRGRVKLQCAGRMLYASKTAKSFRNPVLETIRKTVRDLNDGFREKILGFEILTHHKIK